MSETYGLHLIEAEESDIRWAANEDAEKTRMNLINEIVQSRKFAGDAIKCCQNMRQEIERLRDIVSEMDKVKDAK